MPRTFPPGSRNQAYVSCPAGSTGRTISPPGLLNRVDGRSSIGDHDIDQQTGLGCGRSAGHPCTANLADRVVEGDLTVASLPDLPAEDLAVELG
jgi:hypothetical protein